MPQNCLTPSLAPGRIVQYQGHELLIFDVESTPRAVMVAGDGFPRRCDDQVVQESEQIINAIKARDRRESYEQEPDPDATLGDLDQDLILRAAQAAGLGDLSPDEYLVERRLADRRGENLILRRGAVLLFARSAHAIDHPNAGLRIFRVNGAERLTGARHHLRSHSKIHPPA